MSVQNRRTLAKLVPSGGSRGREEVTGSNYKVFILQPDIIMPMCSLLITIMKVVMICCFKIKIVPGVGCGKEKQLSETSNYHSLCYF
jgi:hypothetical protein